VVLVYADRLVEQGDPRGELAQIQHRLESLPDDPRLRVVRQLTSCDDQPAVSSQS
jgi:hypothetical protein